MNGPPLTSCSYRDGTSTPTSTSASGVRLVCSRGSERKSYRFASRRSPASPRSGVTPVLVESTVSGIELDLRAGRQGWEKPWEVVGELAAAVHELDPALVEVGHETRRAHAQAKLSSFEGLEDTLVLDAKSLGARASPAGDRRAFFCTGIFSGRTSCCIRRNRSGSSTGSSPPAATPPRTLLLSPAGCVDPSRLRTGSVVFSMPYARAGGADVTPTEVHFHELCLVTEQYRGSLDPKTGVHAPEQELNMVRGVLRRAMKRRHGS